MMAGQSQFVRDLSQRRGSWIEYDRRWSLYRSVCGNSRNVGGGGEMYGMVDSTVDAETYRQEEFLLEVFFLMERRRRRREKEDGRG